MKNFHWGHGIAVFFTLFVLITLFQVIKSGQYENAMVKEDYYIDDIQLNKFVEKRRNSQNVNGLKIEVLADSQAVKITLPNMDAATGKIVFQSPISKREDKIFDLALIDGVMVIPTASMRKGKYNLYIDWKDNLKEYSNYSKIILP